MCVRARQTARKKDAHTHTNTYHQDVVVVDELDEAGDGVKDRVHDAHLLAAIVVCQGAHEGAGHLREGGKSVCK